MKKYVTLILILILVLATGCTTKTLKEGAYYDKNNMHNNESLEWIYLKENNVVERTICGADAGCSLYRGTYEITDTALKVTYKEYAEIDGFINLDVEELVTYTITANNEFTRDRSVFILDTRKYDNSITEYDVELIQQDEKFEFGKLNLEFKGSAVEGCKNCYNYTLDLKYDDKQIKTNFFSDKSKINSTNMAASFKVYKIEGVYILASNLGRQCFPYAVLIFDAEGNVLKTYSDVDITVEGYDVTIETSKGSCMEEGIPSYFEVSGLELKEK